MPLKPENPNNALPFLPPDRDVVESKVVLRLESKAAVALAELKGIANTLPNQSILINAIVLKEAKASSEIENIITTHDSLYQALSAKSFKPDSATKEVLRYREALFEGFSFIQKKGFLSTNGIISVQNILEENNAGLRQLPGTVLKNGTTGEIVYTPPDDKDAISRLMSNLEKFLNEDDEDDISPLIKLAIQHYQFESIHPFYDGNGRTGRIVNVLYLMLKGLLDIPILYLSGFIIHNKGEYYRLLRDVTFNNKWEPWIIYILQGIEQTAKDTISQVNDINKLMNNTINIVKEKSPRIYSKDLIEVLFEQPYCKIDFLVDRLNIERKAASRYLQNIEELGILKARKIGRENIYINEKLFDLFKK